LRNIALTYLAIQQQQRAGRWKLWWFMGGAELNLINGESIVRQLLYGQRYVLRNSAMSHKSHGYRIVLASATLPQIFKQGGINISSPKIVME